MKTITRYCSTCKRTMKHNWNNGSPVCLKCFPSFPLSKMRAGDRVVRVNFLRLTQAENRGTVVEVNRDDSMNVRWEDGSEQLVDRRDVRHRTGLE